ncbi:hypothetical protein B0S90_0501 [Caldicellulosiruptor bescii]|uniref:Uncharacterized protein n=2 Tax=Caldicellulosiruptor bescii TaxID=31899 RepID=B9MME9_CALBD|nr:hypothetical protein [Caldicellulosiruptor bescii]ACM59381.1 hypothetical protein Athe_0231 [Caldicellulosiruptor bescii DSM 6725]PBC88162.1 hypothetical protein B0S87_1124 [Caldicellulosiruptor bescii]PBC89743.1 hypothetical protein B0S89_0005 [Caldicellulosiruptor bescii]PBD04832.1 hypothetical protein B0S85_2540 [Caldicellulosiruptor bescii]PBD05538.1 hypothetical protein B0S90_0501 [Caldicellulosiruptor bescii]
MQVYVVRKTPIQELKEFGGRVLNGAKEGLKEVWKNSGIIAGASAAENGIKEAVKGYKAIQEFNVTMKNGYTLRGIQEAGLPGAARGFARGMVKAPGIVGYAAIGISFIKGFIRGWNEYGK